MLPKKMKKEKKVLQPTGVSKSVAHRVMLSNNLSGLAQIQERGCIFRLKIFEYLGHLVNFASSKLFLLFVAETTLFQSKKIYCFSQALRAYCKY
jgi:hypothetical protein